jgi:hypothetical protein
MSPGCIWSLQLLRTKSFANNAHNSDCLLFACRLKTGWARERRSASPIRSILSLLTLTSLVVAGEEAVLNTLCSAQVFPKRHSTLPCPIVQESKGLRAVLLHLVGGVHAAAGQAALGHTRPWFSQSCSLLTFLNSPVVLPIVSLPTPFSIFLIALPRVIVIVSIKTFEIFLR